MRLEYKANPSIRESVEFINENLKRKNNILILGSSIVNYTGRAKSSLSLGERLIIIKKDGSLLIHRSKGYSPINWQPPGSAAHAKEMEGKLIITSIRMKPVETIKITIPDVQLIVSFTLQDKGEFELELSEEAMRKAVICKPDLIEKGFKPLEKEKPTDTGFIDLFGVDQEGRPVVVEFKRRKADKKSVTQLANYIEELEERRGVKTRGILVSPSITKRAARLIEEKGIEYKKLTPRDYISLIKKEIPSKLTDYL